MGKPSIYSSVEEKFLVSFDKEESGCWVWKGARGYKGYGALSFRGKITPAHRYSYEYYKGPIPQGLVIDHLCRNTFCVNPDHLEPVSTKTNLLRGISFSAKNAVKTHCKYGHPFEGDNLRLSNGGRICRTCRRESGRKCDAKRKYQKRRNKRAA
jgi:hypothetical protein